MNDFLKYYLKENKILFVGPLPPPIGGVSIHLHRLTTLLEQYNYNISVFNTSKRYLLSYIKILILFLKVLFNNYDIVHLHSTRKNIIKTILLAKKIKNFKLYFTDHNPRLFSVIENKILYKNFFKKIDFLIAVSSDVINNYKKKGIIFPDNYIIRTAFLPPDLKKESNIFNKYNVTIKKFIQRSSPLLVASAYRLSFINNTDLYGLDLCIELTRKLKHQYPNLGFIFALPDTSENPSKLQEYYKIIEKFLKNNFLIITETVLLWPIIKRATIFIRPTITDGDALSIREALMFGKPVIASDSCIRPESVILFKNRDIEDLTHKTIRTLKNIRNGRDI